jgi:hypothetical protein
LHDGDDAAASAEAMQARAWTAGSHVVLGAGEYRPGTSAFRRLLGHELVHTLQQQDATPSGTMPIAAADTSFEREAERVSGVAMSAHVPAAPVRTSAHPLAVQRALVVDAPKGVQNNLADRILAKCTTAGFVLYSLNGKVLNFANDPNQAPDRDNQGPIKANARQAIKRPQISQRMVEVDGPNGKESRLEGWISGVPEHRLSTEVHTLTSPPWQAATTGGALVAAVRDNRLWRCAGAAPCQFTVKGKPDEVTVAANTLAHEDQHAAHIARDFERVFRPWDTKMREGMKSAQKFSGATAAQATEALWNFLGGSPEAIADALIDAVDASGAAMHAGMAEPELALKDPSSNWGCTTAEVYVEGGS